MIRKEILEVINAPANGWLQGNTLPDVVMHLFNMQHNEVMFYLMDKLGTLNPKDLTVAQYAELNAKLVEIQTEYVRLNSDFPALEKILFSFEDGSDKYGWPDNLLSEKDEKEILRRLELVEDGTLETVVKQLN